MKSALVCPVDVSGRPNGITLPLRELTRTLEELGPWHLVEPDPRPGPKSFLQAGFALAGGVPLAVARSACRLQHDRVKRALDHHRPDVVVGYLGWSAHVIPPEWRSRTLLVISDSLTHMARMNPRVSHGNPLAALATSLNTQLLARYERRTYGHFAGVQVTTPAEERFLRDLGVHAPIIVNPNGVHPPGGPRRRFDERTFDFVSIGDFVVARSREAALRGIQVAGQVAGSRRYLIAGWQAGSVAVSPNGVDVTVMEDVPDLRSAISSARIMVCVDPKATGIKNSVLEAIVEGVVVIANLSVAETLPSGAVEAVTSEVEAVERATLLLAQPALWEQVSERAAQAVAQTFTWAQYRARTRTALEAAAGGASRNAQTYGDAAPPL